jgi:hypothetical protein
MVFPRFACRFFVPCPEVLSQKIAYRSGYTILTQSHLLFPVHSMGIKFYIGRPISYGSNKPGDKFVASAWQDYSSIRGRK